MNHIILLLVASFASGENLVRVFYQPDGKIAVGVANRELCRPAESESACVQRVTDRFCPKNKSGSCLPSTIMEAASLPPRSKRDKWRGSKATGVRADESVITKAEKVAAAEAALDAELAKAEPDSVKVIALQRSLEIERARPALE